MAVYSGAVRFRRYQVLGKIPEDPATTYSEKIKHFSFDPLSDEDVRTEAVGWVATDDWFDTDLYPGRIGVGRQIFMTLRLDERKIPSKILVHECKKLEAEWKEKNDRDRLSRSERDDVKSIVTRNLSARVLPSVRGVDFCWDLDRSELLFFSCAEKVNESFRTIFEKTFTATLRPLIPFALAVRELDEKGTAQASTVYETPFAEGEGR